MMDIFADILASLRDHEQPVLATIISSSGSTPLPPGAKVLLRNPGASPMGTIGGGRIEADVIKAAGQFKGPGGSFLLQRFTLTEDDLESGMLCGGSIDILIERLSGEQLTAYEALVARREAGKDSALVTVIGSASAVAGKALLFLQPEGIADEDWKTLKRLAIDLPDSFEQTVRDAKHRDVVTRLPRGEGECIIEFIEGLRDLIIFGGGHVSRYVSQSAVMAGFRVTVIDDRPEYANARRFPEAHRTLAVGFDASWDQLQITPSTSIVIVTRGHRFDERVLERALDTPAQYIGMIGSKRKVAATYGNLAARGVSWSRLQMVHAPIGLDIGAVTAEEIGISITAELIARRRGVTFLVRAMKDTMKEFLNV
jgi:xanthine dehydrogenase accessory factor